MKYDYLIVGSGLFGSTIAYKLNKSNKKVLVIEKRDHIGGNAYTEDINGIPIHKYGAHIFHTNDKDIWEFVNSLVEFNRYTNSPLANYNGEIYNLPFNMNTFYKLWGLTKPEEVKNKIKEQSLEMAGKEPSNLEEQAISLVGRDIYERLIKGYTEKQWGKNAKELPTFIIKRLPVRYTYDNNYFSDRYQGIPIGGYTRLFEKLLEGIEVRLGVDYLKNRDEFKNLAKKIIYTGPIDQYFDYKFGELEYRSLRFENELFEIENYQGNAVVNYTDAETKFTRIIEHKHFDNTVMTKNTIITREFPMNWKKGDEPYYPLNDESNMELLKKYRKLAVGENNLIFGGRLAEYKYYDMHQVIRSAFNLYNKLELNDE